MPIKMAIIKKKRKVLVRRWKNWNPHVLLLGNVNGMLVRKQFGSYFDIFHNTDGP